MDFKRRLFNRFALVLFAVFVLNSLAGVFFWYQSFFWFDMLTHFLGGVAGGLFLCFFFYKRFLNWRDLKLNRKIILLHGISFLIVALAWEFMEFSVQDAFNIGNALAEKNDSVSDILFGLFGSYLSLSYYFVRIRKHDK